MNLRSVSFKLMSLAILSALAFAALGAYGIGNAQVTFARIGEVHEAARDIRAASRDITGPLNETRRLSLSVALAQDPPARRELAARHAERSRELEATLRGWPVAEGDARESEAFAALLAGWERYQRSSERTVQKATSGLREEALANANGEEQRLFDDVLARLEGWTQARIDAADTVYRRANDRHRRTVTVSVCVLVLLTLGAAAVVLLVARGIVRPIHVLQGAARRIAGREPVTSIPVRSGDELGELARDMERMAGSIRDYVERQRAAEAEVRALNAGLEQRVELRTAELRAVSEKRRLEEQRYRSLVEATTAIVWNTPASGEFESEQPGWSAFTGQSYDELKGWGWLNAVHPDDRPSTARVWSAAVASRSLYQVEHRLRRHDGEYRHMLVRAVPILDDAGEIREWVGIHTDIDDRKRAESDLREAKEAAEASAAWARLVVDTAYDAFVVMDQRGRIIDWNPQAEVIFGWTRAEALGRPLAETIIPAEYREAHQRGLERFLATGEGPVLGQRIELTALRRDGQTFPVELTIRPIHRAGEYAFSAFLHDIAARKRAEAELLEAKEEAERASRAKSEFLANMSHEIRTPMNGILGMTELALDSDLTPEQREYLGAVKLSADYLLAVINDILDFSKIEAGKLDLDPVDFNLRDHLDETVTTLALRAHAKGLELACHVLDDVPDALVGDPGRLRQVVLNLVGNAVKFTGRGEVVMRVEAEEVNGEDAVLHFAIRDTGIGIPAAKLGVLFKAFSQVDGSTTRRYGGTGLGLAISSQLVRLMGGRVWVESEEGKGSTFHFTMRFGLSRNPAPRHAPAELARLKDLPVLVVDDNATNRRILHELLTNWGTRPTAVGGGREALDAMRRAAGEGTPFAVVLLDHMMPEMDGLMLAEQIQRNPSLAGAVLMMLSSADRRETAARCRERGVTAYLTKPVRRTELLNALLRSVSAPSAEASLPTARRGIAPCGRGLRVLLAEDNAVNQKLAVRLLEKRGHSVVVVDTGRDVLAALEQGVYDVVLMDVMMPEMDGFEATAAIRARERESGGHVPIIAMTAHAMKGDRERCLEVGMDGYVSKPLQPGELFDAVERLTGVSAESPPVAPPEGG